MHFSGWFRYGLIFTSAFLLIACTNLPMPNQSQTTYEKQSWQQRRATLNRIDHWNIAGAFSIRQPNKSTIAAYTWQQQGQSYRINIHSSLDLYSVNIAGQPGLVMLWRGNKERFSANSPEALMQQQLGWRLPVSNLYYWLRGLPAPGNYQASFDNYGHIIMLNQQGWQLHYANYLSVGAVDLPQILDLTNDELQVKIVIKRWAGF